MEHIDFPGDFPSFETMMSVLKKVFEKSWKVDLDIEDINLWLGNFTGTFFDTEDERRLALWMLCNFTYYNDSVFDGKSSLCVAPLSTKPVALGVCLYAMSHKTLRIVYPTSEHYNDHRTNKVLNTNIYSIPLQSI